MQSTLMPMPLQPHQQPQQQRGLTLIELMVTVALLTILLGLAAPSFRPMMERWQANQAADELESALFFARSESIRRGGGLSLIRTTPAGNCAAAANEWQCGWTLAMDTDQDGVADAFDTGQENTVLRHASRSYTNLTITASANGTAILIDRWGRLSLKDTAGNFSFTVRPSAQPSADTSRLCITPGGHLQKIKASADCKA